MVEVFKTNVDDPQISEALTHDLCNHFFDCRINFDLQDCDHILRVECERTIKPWEVISFLRSRGFWAEVLQDVTSNGTKPHTLEAASSSQDYH